MKVIAFYLPQFYSFPENDNWWGSGFTEWTNMKKAKPLYEGHYQPRTPKDNNYYNLSDPEVLKWQARIARQNGIYGFCFYHYWFSGKMLMEKPVANLLSNNEIDINYCFSWANETWTRAWASRTDEILIEQTYGMQEEWLSHFNYLLPFFKDKRYIKEKGKPVFIIYRPENIPCLPEMIEFWNNLALKNGFLGISFSYQQVDFFLSNSPYKKLFCHNIEYEPAYVRALEGKKICMLKELVKRMYKIILKSDGSNIKKQVTRLNYDDAWNKILQINPAPGAIPCAMVGWDNTPRRGTRGWVYDGATPQKFEEYFSQLIKKTKKEYKQNVIFVFAWNEWSEGGYLEPDEKYGYRYLEAIKRALIENDENEELY